MKFFKSIILLHLAFFLFSCGSIKEGFKNQKKENSDEFLVEKKSPLVMPPDYNDLPVPNTNNKQIQNTDDSIKELITNEQGKSIDVKAETFEKDFEKLLLEKIKSN